MGHAGVCDKPTTLHARTGGATGGIYEFASEEFRKRWWHDVPLDHPSVFEIKCDTLDSLLLEYARNVTYFDFFSLDVEGAEMSVLQSVDFDRVGFGVVFVEADHHNERKNLAVKMLIVKGIPFCAGLRTILLVRESLVS